MPLRPHLRSGLDVYGRGGLGLYRAEMPRDVVAEAFAEIYGGGLDTAMALTAFCGDECATLAAHPLLDELSDKYHEPRSVPWGDVEALMRAAAASYAGAYAAAADAGAVAGAGDVAAAGVSGVQKLLLMGVGDEDISRVRPRWEAAFGSRAVVTQAVSNMLEVLPPGNGKVRIVDSTLPLHSRVRACVQRCVRVYSCACVCTAGFVCVQLCVYRR